MLNACSVQFPEVKYQKAKCTDEKHNYQKAVSGACHDVEGEGEQNGHVVDFELVHLFEPTLNDGILF
jgi:hypothetical protein